MRYKPERALTLSNPIETLLIELSDVEMRYKPERALTRLKTISIIKIDKYVEMRYKPERALTHFFEELFNQILEM